jgi:hypothetical protein
LKENQAKHSPSKDSLAVVGERLYVLTKRPLFKGDAASVGGMSIGEKACSQIGQATTTNKFDDAGTAEIEAEKKSNEEIQRWQ